MEKIDYFTAFYGTEETEQKLKIAARSDEWTAIFCFRFEKEKSAVLYVAPFFTE